MQLGSEHPSGEFMQYGSPPADAITLYSSLAIQPDKIILD